MPSSLVTGSVIGNVLSQEEIYLEGSPYIFYQDDRVTPLYSPDAQGYYWGLTGSVLYPPVLLGCIQDVKLTEGLTMNDVRCDTIGVKDTIQKRNYVEFQFTILSLMPLNAIWQVFNMSRPSTGTGYETMGIGQINNNVHYHVYAPKVYDPDAAGWLMFYLHKAKFVDAWNIDMTYGDAWKATGIKVRAFANDNYPANQIFGVIKRFDPTLP